VAPQQLYLKLGGAALAPFAWEVPGQFVAYAVLLKSLGVQEEPRADDLVRGRGMLEKVWLLVTGCISQCHAM
jgi:hypothetical protein